VKKKLTKKKTIKPKRSDQAWNCPSEKKASVIRLPTKSVASYLMYLPSAHHANGGLEEF